VFRRITLVKFDAFSLKLRAHGWVCVLIGSGNPVTCTSGQQGHATHECAAGTEYVKMHFLFPST
jgi:hypothetical protein